MIENTAAVRLGSAAASHVEAVRDKTGFERRLGKASGVSGFAGALQAVNNNEMTVGRFFRALRLNQHAPPRLGFMQNRMHRETSRVEHALPIVPGNSQQVRTTE